MKYNKRKRLFLVLAIIWMIMILVFRPEMVICQEKTAEGSEDLSVSGLFRDLMSGAR